MYDSLDNDDEELKNISTPSFLSLSLSIIKPSFLGFTVSTHYPPKKDQSFSLSSLI